MGAPGQKDTVRHQESIKALQGGRRKDKGEPASVYTLGDQIRVHIHRGLVDVLIQRDVKRQQHNILILNRTLSVMSRDTLLKMSYDPWLVIAENLAWLLPVFLPLCRISSPAPWPSFTVGDPLWMKIGDR